MQIDANTDRQTDRQTNEYEKKLMKRPELLDTKTDRKGAKKDEHKN